MTQTTDKNFEIREIRAELKDQAEELRQHMLESIVETSDELMENSLVEKRLLKRKSDQSKS